MIPAILNINTYRSAKTFIAIRVQTSGGTPLDLGQVRLQVYNKFSKEPFIDNEMTWNGTAYTLTLSSEETTLNARDYSYHLWNVTEEYPIIKGRLAVSDVFTTNTVTISDTITINQVTNVVTVSDENIAAGIAVAAQEETEALRDEVVLAVTGFDDHVEDKKLELDAYVDDPLKLALDAYEVVKEGELDAHTFLKEGELNTHTDTKKDELDAHTLLKEGELDAYSTAKEGEIDVHTGLKKDELDAYSTFVFIG